MRVLIACEFSGIVRDAFDRRGHDAWSCDLLPTERAGNHIEGDVLKELGRGWDLLIAHPPCTYLCRSGARWWKQRKGEQMMAISFFMALARCDIPRIAIENPIGLMNTLWRKPDQIIQPWQFGHGEVKATCLWLKGLPLLHSTNIVQGREPRVHYAAPGRDRWKERSRTVAGIAQAMATQWSEDLVPCEVCNGKGRVPIFVEPSRCVGDVPCPNCGKHD